MIQARPHGWRTVPNWRTVLHGSIAAVLLVAVGCTQSTDTVDPQVLASHRERLLLAEEPDGAVGVVDLRDRFAATGDASAEQLAASASTEPADQADHADNPGPDQPVVLVGRIGGVPNPWKQAKPDYPWSRHQAEFVIADAAAAAEIEGHGHAHDDPDHECPFCSSAAGSEVVAVVRFRDDTGRVIPIDARELFDLQGGETVVVRGKPQIRGDDHDGLLLVDADALYVRR